MILKKVKNEIGATAIEYGLLASLIGVLAVSSMSAIGMNLSNTYCTISTHLGGSGTCSGATSGSSSGTGNVSLADGASLADLQNSLSDKLDVSYVDASQGGTTKSAGGPWWINNEFASDGVSMDSLEDARTQMEDINASDPITNVLGIYDTATGKPITDYNSVLSGIKDRLSGNGFVDVTSDHLVYKQSISTYYKDGAYDNYGGDMEVTTQSGKVYIINGNSAKESAQK